LLFASVSRIWYFEEKYDYKEVTESCQIREITRDCKECGKYQWSTLTSVECALSFNVDQYHTMKSTRNYYQIMQTLKASPVYTEYIYTVSEFITTCLQKASDIL
jgi:hypothetical protein